MFSRGKIQHGGILCYAAMTWRSTLNTLRNPVFKRKTAVWFFYFKPPLFVSVQTRRWYIYFFQFYKETFWRHSNGTYKKTAWDQDPIHTIRKQIEKHPIYNLSRGCAYMDNVNTYDITLHIKCSGVRSCITEITKVEKML